MKTFIVTGEYGIQEGEFVRLTLKAKNEENARNNFIKKIAHLNLPENIKNNIRIIENKG